MDEPLAPPPALVLGCNTPHGIGVLPDWIEEQTGHAPDFADVGWSDGSVTGGNIDAGDGTFYGNGYGDGYGIGDCGDIYGNGYGAGDGYGYSNGDGRSVEYGNDDRLDDVTFGCSHIDSIGTHGFWRRIGQRLRQLIQ